MKIREKELRILIRESLLTEKVPLRFRLRGFSKCDLKGVPLVKLSKDALKGYGKALDYAGVPDVMCDIVSLLAGFAPAGDSAVAGIDPKEVSIDAMYKDAKANSAGNAVGTSKDSDDLLFLLPNVYAALALTTPNATSVESAFDNDFRRAMKINFDGPSGALKLDLDSASNFGDFSAMYDAILKAVNLEASESLLGKLEKSFDAITEEDAKQAAMSAFLEQQRNELYKLMSRRWSRKLKDDIKVAVDDGHLQSTSQDEIEALVTKIVESIR